MRKRVVILGAGISGMGAALLAKKMGLDVFVSDNSKNKVTNINKDSIDCLVKKNFLAVKNCLKNLIVLSEEIFISKQKPKSFYELTSKYSFTFSQKIALEDLLKKWQLLFPKRKLDVIINDCKDSKSVIVRLKSDIDETAISWS